MLYASSSAECWLAVLQDAGCCMRDQWVLGLTLLHQEYFLCVSTVFAPGILCVSTVFAPGILCVSTVFAPGILSLCIYGVCTRNTFFVYLRRCGVHFFAFPSLRRDRVYLLREDRRLGEEADL